MKQTITFLFLFISTVLSPFLVYSQITTIATGLPNSVGSLAATQCAVTFTISNNNSYSIILKDMDFYRDVNQNGLTFNLRYSSTSLSGQTSPVVSSWSIIATTTSSNVTALGIHPLFTGINFTIPANTTYRFAVQHSGASLNYGGAATTPNSYTSNGVTLGRGNYQIAGADVGFAGSSGTTLAFNPRFWCGTITFEPGAANNVSALSLIAPANNSQLCYNSGLIAKALVKNAGTQPQSNFPVVADYSGPIIGTLSSTYIGTLSPGVTDTVEFALLNLPSGSYTMKAYTQLSIDTLKFDDTSAVSSFVIKAPVALPIVLSDTVCIGNNASLLVNSQANTTYSWFSQLTGGILVNTGNTLNFPSLTQDTTMYVSATVSGCESGRVPITAAIGPPPTLDFGPDTSFCESIPLILDAGNAGGTYMWSTGDSTQTITITNISGQYWVVVDKYCTASDTIDVTIAPVASVDGISYVRMASTYSFSATNPLDVSNYVWDFGDGTTLAGTSSTGSQPITAVHTYAHGINASLKVKLIVNNNCGTDTTFRFVPTGVNDLEESEDGVRVFPNPAADEVNIYTGDEKIEEVQIFSMEGKLMTTRKLVGIKNTIDVRDLSPGVYILRLASNEGVINKPIQVTR